MNIATTISQDEIVETITNTVVSSARVGKVLFLLPGGSNIELARPVLETIAQMDESKNITLTLTDERYGPVGHAESNWLAYQSVLQGTNFGAMPVLDGTDPEETAVRWGAALASKAADHTVIGFFGIGADGHIAGIKPDMPRDTSGMATQYQAEDFLRVTITPDFFPLIDHAYAYMKGEAKQPVLTTLERDSPSIDIPARLIGLTKEYLVYYTYN